MRVNASGRSNQIKLEMPKRYKPLVNGIYKVRIEVTTSETKRVTVISIRDLECGFSRK